MNKVVEIREHDLHAKWEQTLTATPDGVCAKFRKFEMSGGRLPGVASGLENPSNRPVVIASEVVFSSSAA